MRTLVRRDFEQAFARVDVIVAPTTPGVAFKMGEKEDPMPDVPERHLHDPGEPGRAARHLGPGRLHRRPACPIGLQLIGRAFDEATLLRAAHAYQQVTDLAHPQARARLDGPMSACAKRLRTSACAKSASMNIRLREEA